MRLMPVREMPPKPWTTEELAEYLDLKVDGIYHLIRNDELAFSRVGRGLRFTYADINSLLDRRRSGHGVGRKRRRSDPAPRHDEPPVLLGVEAVADHLGLTSNGIYYLVREDRIAYMRIGKSLRFSIGDVQAYLDREKDGRGTVAASPLPVKSKGGRPRKSYDRAA